MGKECDCQEFQDSMKQILNAQMFCAFHTAAPKYTGSLFEFCPWCGSRLLAVTEANEGGTNECQ